MVNGLNSVAFLINKKKGLSFNLDNYKKFHLLIDPDYIHPFTFKSKLRWKERIRKFNSRDKKKYIGLSS